MERTRRLCNVTFVCLLLVAASGCLTVQPTVDTRTGDSGVFKSVSTDSEWGTSSVQASVTLSRSATTKRGVTRLTVIAEDGSSFYATTVDSGQTSVTLPLPTEQSSQIVAVNTVNGTVVGTQNVTVGGSTYP